MCRKLYETSGNYDQNTSISWLTVLFIDSCCRRSKMCVDHMAETDIVKTFSPFLLMSAEQMFAGPVYHQSQQATCNIKPGSATR